MTLETKFTILIVELGEIKLENPTFRHSCLVFISDDLKLLHDSFYKLTNLRSFFLTRKILDWMVETESLESCLFEVVFILNQSRVEPCLSSSSFFLFCFQFFCVCSPF